MKLATVALFFFLFGFTTAHHVLDTEGEPIFNSAGHYYILPVMRGRGGGLEVANINDEDCPRTVVQARKEVSNGLPVRFSSPLKILHIYPTMNLNIEFTKPPSCAPKPASWTVLEEYSSEKGSAPVKISDELRLFGPFQIRETGKDYKLVYCKERNSGESKCIDLGIEIDDENNRRLVLKEGDPLIVRFKNADRERSEERSIV